VRRLVEAAFDEHRAGLADAGHGHAQVQVVRQCAVHQLFQHRIIELRPPAGHRRVVLKTGCCAPCSTTGSCTGAL
jgi:hypothetical protein